MIKRTLLALAALSVLGSSGALAASSSNQNDKARLHLQFSDLVALKASSIQDSGSLNSAAIRPAQSLLTPALVHKFDQRFIAYLHRFGLHPPPLTSFLPDTTIAFRREFIRERFTPGVTIGGVFFTTSATPSVPGRFVNVFQFFPVYRFF